AFAGVSRAGEERAAVRGGYVSCGGDRATGNLGTAHRDGSDQDQSRGRSRGGVVRRAAGRGSAQDGLRGGGYGGTPAYENQFDGGTGKDAADGAENYSRGSA